jgi:mannose-6-phosphate isomerase-like protein (cupin superfamily)
VAIEEQSHPVQIIAGSRGERMEVPPDGISPDGASYTFDWYLPPHSPAPPPHWHPRQEERFEVISGQFTVMLGDTKHVLRPGDTIVVPVGGLHAVANDTDEETCVRTVFAPALDIHMFFETLFAIRRSSQGLMQLARMSVLFRAMPDYIGFPAPLRLVAIVLASITRLLGYRLPVPRYA